MKRLLVLLSAYVLLAAVPATAQQANPRPQRPYRGLFGGGVGEAQHALVLNAFFGGGYDDISIKTTSPNQANSVDAGGGFGTGMAELSYWLSRPRGGVSATVGSTGRYYPSLDDGFVAVHSGTVGAFYQIARRTRLAGRHTSSYQPFTTLGLFPQLVDVAGEAATVRRDPTSRGADHLSQTSSVDLTHVFSPRASLTLDYGFARNDFASDFQDFKSQRGGGHLIFPLARSLNLRAGYAYTDATYNVTHRVRGHSFDGGLEYSRALSFSRRTRLSFATGSSILSDHDQTLYRITGNARLTREIGRTWNASLAYDRTAGFVDALAESVFSDAATFALTGLINRRVQFQSSIAASAGEFPLVDQESSFDSYYGSVGITVGLTRHVGVGVTYSLYRYSFDPGAPLPPGSPVEWNGQGIQANLALAVPLFQRSRRTDASR